MPEGPEVARISESLNKNISNKKIISVKMTKKSRYYENRSFDGSNLLSYGLKIVSVIARAKRIIFNMVDPGGKNLIMISFLAMTGQWVKYRTKYTSFIFQFGLIDDRKYKITDTFYYNDTRKIGFLKCLDTMEGYKNVFKFIGPDLLHDEIPFDVYLSVLRSKKLVGKEIVWFLLEQKFFSGIGNYLKSEVLYASGVSPNRTIRTLTDLEIYKIYTQSIKIIKLSYIHNGLTFSDYIDPDGNKGNYDPLIYNKTIDPFGNQISINTFTDKRITYWVPSVQK